MSEFKMKQCKKLAFTLIFVISSTMYAYKKDSDININNNNQNLKDNCLLNRQYKLIRFAFRKFRQNL